MPQSPFKDINYKQVDSDKLAEIVDVHTHKKEHFFLVLWKDRTDVSHTWEPARVLPDDLIEAFWKSKNMENKTLEMEKERLEWIEKETQKNQQEKEAYEREHKEAFLNFLKSIPKTKKNSNNEQEEGEEGEIKEDTQQKKKSRN